MNGFHTLIHFVSISKSRARFDWIRVNRIFGIPDQVFSKSLTVETENASYVIPRFLLLEFFTHLLSMVLSMTSQSNIALAKPMALISVK
jgi:hypothetical protein